MSALPAPSPADYGRVAAVLGGPAVLGRAVDGPIALHDLLVRGLPAASIRHLVAGVPRLPGADVARALGVSLRTVQRMKERADRLGTAESGRAWKLAEAVARASDVFGSRAAAEAWLEAPATGLDGRRPIDLLASTAGTEAVLTFLERIDHGVYA